MNCKLGDVLYYNRKSKKFRIVENEKVKTIEDLDHERIMTFYGNLNDLCVGLCVIEPGQIDDYPRFAFGETYVNYHFSDYIQELIKDNKCIDEIPNYSSVGKNIDKWLQKGEWLNDFNGYGNCQMYRQAGCDFDVRNDIVGAKGLKEHLYIPAIGELVLTKKNRVVDSTFNISSSQSDAYWIKYKQTGIQLVRKDIPTFETLMFIHIDEKNFEIGEK